MWCGEVRTVIHNALVMTTTKGISMTDGGKRLHNYNEQKRLHSCEHCCNHKCQTKQVMNDTARYLRMLGGDDLVDDFKSYVGSECDMFVYSLNTSEKERSSKSTFSEVSEKLLHKYNQ